MLKIVQDTGHFSGFVYEKKRFFFFKTLTFFQQSIFLNTVTYFFRYFYSEIEILVFLFQIENFGIYADSGRAI